MEGPATGMTSVGGTTAGAPPAVLPKACALVLNPEECDDRNCDDGRTTLTNKQRSTNGNMITRADR